MTEQLDDRLREAVASLRAHRAPGEPTDGLEHVMRRAERPRGRTLAAGAIAVALLIPAVASLVRLTPVEVEFGDTGREPDQGPAERQPSAEDEVGPPRTPSVDTGVTLLFSTDSALHALDVDTASVRRIDIEQLTGGDPPYRMSARGDAVVFYGGDTYAFDAWAPEQPRRLGSSTYYLPSGEPDRVWLVDGRTSTAHRNTVTEVTLEGEVTVPMTETPEGTIGVAAVRGGIVLNDHESLSVWDPVNVETTRVLEGGAFVLDTFGDRIAWCGNPCATTTLSNLADGEDVEVPAPEGGEWLPHTGAWSPDGRYLALGWMSEAGTSVGLVDAHDGDVTALQERMVEPPSLAWSPSGDLLFATMRDDALVIHTVASGRSEVVATASIPRPFHGVVAVPALHPQDSLDAFGEAEAIPLDDESVLTVGGWNSGVVRKLHAESRDILWSVDLGEYAWIGVVSQGVVVTGGRPGVVRALDLGSGQRRWDLEVDPSSLPGRPTLADTTLFVPVTFGFEGDVSPPRVYAVDLLDGTVRWETTLLEGADLQWAPPVVTDELVLVADTLSHPGSADTSWLHALDRRTGEIVWRFDLEDDRQGFHTEAPLVAGDRVAVAGSHGPLFAVDLATGEEVWRRGRSSGAVVELVEASADGETITVVLDGVRQVLRTSDGQRVDP